MKQTYHRFFYDDYNPNKLYFKKTKIKLLLEISCYLFEQLLERRF